LLLGAPVRLPRTLRNSVFAARTPPRPASRAPPKPFAMGIESHDRSPPTGVAIGYGPTQSVCERGCGLLPMIRQRVVRISGSVLRYSSDRGLRLDRDLDHVEWTRSFDGSCGRMGPQLPIPPWTNSWACFSSFDQHFFSRPPRSVVDGSSRPKG
jgi:hypothetical protein